VTQFALDPKTAVLDALQAHIGAAAASRARDLAAAAGLTERDVRHQVSALREEGIAICGHPSTGYFIAANAEELQITVEFLKARAMHSLRLASRLTKIPLVDLIGQLKLKT
jgi:predicted DNA-binding transcriptional regulator YafY